MIIWAVTRVANVMLFGFIEALYAFVGVDWGAPSFSLGGKMDEEEPSFALSSDSDSESSDEGGLVMKKVCIHKAL